MTIWVFLGNAELVKENVQKHNFYNNFENFDGSVKQHWSLNIKGKKKREKNWAPLAQRKKKRNFLMIIYIYILLFLELCLTPFKT